MKHIVCYSGGQSSAEVALSVAKKYGTNNLILLNHDISANVEAQSIKDFKLKVAKYLGVEIAYANHPKTLEMDQFDICVEAQAFKVGDGNNALCTSRLKTEPFKKWLNQYYQPGDVIYYGYDASEQSRINRRAQMLGIDGYKTDFVLASWPVFDRVLLKSTNIDPPCTYGVFKHANCVGCLKAKKQHWYCVYIFRNDLFEKAKWAESEIGYSIQKSIFLEELEKDFELFASAGVVPTERVEAVRYWVEAKKRVASKLSGQINWDFYDDDTDNKPCDCVF